MRYGKIGYLGSVCGLGHMHNEGVEAWSVLGLEDPGKGAGIPGIGTKTIHSLGGYGNQQAIADGPGSPLKVTGRSGQDFHDRPQAFEPGLPSNPAH
jgi:hypothetical protein